MNANEYFNGTITLMTDYSLPDTIIELVNNIRREYKGFARNNTQSVGGKYILHVWDLLTSVSGDHYD